MIARGSSSNLLASSWSPSTGWSSWTNLGQCMVGDPSVASKSTGSMDVLFEGCNGTGNNLWWLSWTSSGGWAGSSAEIGTTRITSAPSVTSRASGLLGVFAASGSTLYQNWYSGGWASGGTLGGCITGAPAAVSKGSGSMDIFAQDCTPTSGNNLDQLTYSGGAWQSWATAPLHVANTPSVASMGMGEIDVATTNSSNQVEQSDLHNSSSSWSGCGFCLICVLLVRPSVSS